MPAGSDTPVILSGGDEDNLGGIFVDPAHLFYNFGTGIERIDRTGGGGVRLDARTMPSFFASDGNTLYSSYGAKVNAIDGALRRSTTSTPTRASTSPASPATRRIYGSPPATSFASTSPAAPPPSSATRPPPAPSPSTIATPTTSTAPTRILKVCK